MHVDVEADGRDIAAIIDGRPISALQVRLLALIATAIVMDGFDVQAMGFVAPAVVQDWHIAIETLGPIFAAGLIGMLLGSIGLGMLSDRIGRRPVLIGALLSFGLFTFATAFAPSVAGLLAGRLLAGLGLGGVMGNAIALASELSPARRRATILMALSCGFTGGAIAGGLLSAVLIPVAGWRSVFMVGGALPLLISALMAAMLPESLHFSASRGLWSSRSKAALERIAPGTDALRLRATPRATASGRGSVTGLLRDGRAAATVILWAISCANMLQLFFLASWLPTLAVRMGYAGQTAVLIGTMLQVGGVAGALAMGPLIDRYGFRWMLAAAFAIACLSIAAMSDQGLGLLSLMTLVLLAGIGVAGAQPAINTLATYIYPTPLRAAGVGWALGIGRAGAIASPIIASRLIALHWSNHELLAAAAVPAAVSCLLILILPRTSSY